MAIADAQSSVIRTLLSAATNAWSFLIGSSPNINLWSRYKPVRGVWPQGTTGKYGLNVPTDWSYLQPRGATVVATENFRAGDFRGYENDRDVAGPTVYNNQASCTATGTHLKPSDAPTTYTIVFNMNTAHEDVRIIPSDLGLQNYYWGVKLVLPSGGGTYYKTHTSVLGNGYTFTINAEINNPATPDFVNCPYAIGEFTWSSFISSTSAASWTTSAPSDIIYLPTGTYGSKTVINSGTFTVDNWMTASDQDMDWLSNDYGYANAISSVINCNTGISRWYITDSIAHPFPAWLTYKVYNESDTLDITASPTQWVDGCILKLYPTIAQDPGDPALTGTVYLSDVDDGSNDLLSIATDQEEGRTIYNVNITTWPSDTSGLTVSATTGYVYEGESLLHLAFTPDDHGGSNYTLYYRILYRGVDKGTGTIGSCNDGTPKTASVSASETAEIGDVPIAVQVSGDLIT